MADEAVFDSSNELTVAAAAVLLEALFIDRANLYAVQVKTPDGCIYQPVEKPLNRDVITRHLRGEMTIGFYPGMEKTRCLAVDLDSRDKQQLRAVLENLKALGIEGVVEDSGKKGFHILVFFKVAIPNWKARQIGRFVCCGHEIFPKQDKVEKFGSLLKLALGVH